MSYLSPIDAPQVYFEPLHDDDCDPGRRSDRLEDARERFERFEDTREGGRDGDCGDREIATRFERFERFEDVRLDDSPGAHPLPRL